jgi:predicted DNA-binding protein YlxM (UPF0122 family)
MTDPNRRWRGRRPSWWGGMGTLNPNPDRVTVLNLWHRRDEEPALCEPVMPVCFYDDGHDAMMRRVLLNELWDVANVLLTRRELLVMRLLYIEGKTLEEAGAHFRVTRERVRQIEKKALRWMLWGVERPLWLKYRRELKKQQPEEHAPFSHQDHELIWPQSTGH